MGFRNGAYATVWDIQPKSPKITVLRLSTSKKPRGSDEYVTDFSGFCACLGETVATAAKGLKVGDKIKLGEVETTSTYNKQTKENYVNYSIFSFERAESNQAKPQGNVDEPEVPGIDDGEVGEEFPW